MTDAAEEKRRARRMPWWVAAIMLAFAAIEPLTHAWIALDPPPGRVPTGLHIRDTAYFQCAMNAFDSGFFSPYARSDAAAGQYSRAWFPLPDHYLYGAIGWTARRVGLDPFLALGLANGLGVLLMLAAAWAFFGAVADGPRARLAFLVYTLGGGLGGVAWLAAGALGWREAPGFEEAFLRFAQYELIEHGYLAPHLIAPRLYYTLALACCLGGLAACIRGGRARLAAAGVLLFLGTVVNLRIGPLTWAAALLYALAGPDRGRLRGVMLLALPVAAGVALDVALLRQNPALTRSYGGLMQFSLWLSPFLLAHVFHIPAWPAAAARLRGVHARLGWAVAAYLAAFAALYLAWMLYFGGWTRFYDGTIARRVSDWALVAVPIGLVLAWRRRSPHGDAEDTAWVTLWFLGLTALAVSAWGQGWFLRFAPARLSAVLGPPLALVTACELYRWRPALRRTLVGAMTACGIVSIAVACLVFQGPLGARPGTPYAYLHHEFMTPRDAWLLDALVPGDRVVAPASGAPQFGDLATMRVEGVSTAYGLGLLVFSDIDILQRRDEVLAFFDPQTTNEARHRAMTRWGATAVLCPEQPPVDPRVLDALRDAPWLHAVAGTAHGALFRVNFGDSILNYQAQDLGPAPDN